MNPATNSEILKAARKRIADRSNTYICFAIADSNVGTDRQKKALIGGISLLLRGHNFYSNWIRANHPTLSNKALSGDEYEKQFRPGRLAWLDSMIAEELVKEAA